MAQILTDIADILKYKYQPALANQINTDPSPFLEAIRKTPATNATIKSAAPIGLNGGFGFGSDGGTPPVSGAQKYAQFSLDCVDMFVTIEISDKTIKLGSSNMSSMINALDQEVQGSFASAKWNVGRSLFGNGNGILCATTSADSNGSSTSTITVDSVDKLIEGLTVDIYTYAAADSTSGTLAAANKGLRIVGIDRVNKTITVNSEGLAVTVKQTGSAAPTAANTYGFITVQNSYNKELCGLGAIFDSSVTSLYGLTKSDYPWLSPVTVDASHDITDTVLYSGVSQAKRIKSAGIDMIMMGDDAFAAYQAYMRENNVHVQGDQNYSGGAVGYKVIMGSQSTVIVNEQFVPTNEAWGVDTKAFYLESTPWDFVSENGSIFVLQPNTTYHRALLSSYGNLMCTNPGGCVRYINCGIS